MLPGLLIAFSNVGLRNEILPKVLNVGFGIFIAHGGIREKSQCLMCPYRPGDLLIDIRATSCAPQYPWSPHINSTTLISCSKHAMATFSEWPFLSANLAL
jgi:hypothetical protein